jgi:hypothetical protein
LQLAIFTDAANNSIAGQWRKIMENDAGPRAALPENFENSWRTQRKSAA